MTISGTRTATKRAARVVFDYCKATDTMTMQDWYHFVTQVVTVSSTHICQY
jgi:hypothetical protein